MLARGCSPRNLIDAQSIGYAVAAYDPPVRLVAGGPRRV